MERFDHWASIVVAVLEIVGGFTLTANIPRFFEIGVFSVSLLVLYMVIEGFRLRNWWLCAVLTGGQTFLLGAGLVFGPGTWEGPLDILGPALQAAVIGAVPAALVALLAARLARPTRLGSLVSRFTAFMVPEALTDLGLPDASRSAAGSGSEEWLYEPDRIRVIESLLNGLRELDMPRIGATKLEVDRGEASRLFPKVSCPVCSGKGLVTCPRCSSPQTSVDVEVNPALCQVCGGHQLVPCSCVEVVTFRIPRGVPSGYIVRGFCDRTDHRHYASVHSSSLGRPGRPILVFILALLGLTIGLLAFILGVVGIVDEPEYRSVYLPTALAGIAWLVAGIPLLKGIGWGWQLMRISLGSFVLAGAVLVFGTPAGILGVLQGGLKLESLIGETLLFILMACVMLLIRHWHEPSIRGYFGAPLELVESLASGMLSASDRFMAAMRSRFVRRSVWALGLTLAAWVLLDAGLGPYWDLARAEVAAHTGGHNAAIYLYSDAADLLGKSPAGKRALHASHRERLSELQDMIARADRQPMEWGQSMDMAWRCDELALQSDRLVGNAKRRAPKLILQCSEILLKDKSWDEANQVLRAIVISFPDSEAARGMGNRAEWRFDELVNVSRVDSVLFNPHVIQESGQFVLRHDDYKPAEGLSLVVAELSLAHVGRTSKQLVIDCMALVDGKGNSYPAVGIIDVFTDEYDDQVHHLLTVQEYDGVSVGPDLETASVVFEVPIGVDTFRLRLDQNLVTEVTVY